MGNKTIWIWNHYATNMFFEKGGRHHWFAKYLIKKGYDVKIFCASTIHNSDFEVDLKGSHYITDVSESIEYVFVKTPKYVGNGKSRIKNMVAFYRGLFSVSKEIKKKSGKPGIILASSVHPLTLVAGIKIAKKFKIPCVCEVRDLWPESIVEMGTINRQGVIAKILYKGEKWIYKRADKLIFTMPGGKDYIKEHKWDDKIKLTDIYNINNGVDLDDFNIGKNTHVLTDDDLNNDDSFKVVYTGSIRTANCVEDLVEVADICKNRGIDDISFFIYGNGDQQERLETYVKEKHLTNVFFKGRVEKKYIPYILSKCDLNIITGEDSDLGRYGVSLNKLFEYMASGKPIIANYKIKRYNLIDDYNIGTAKRFASIEAFADEVIRMSRLTDEEYAAYEEYALEAATEFDYKNLTEKLEAVLNEAVREYGHS